MVIFINQQVGHFGNLYRHTLQGVFCASDTYRDLFVRTEFCQEFSVHTEKSLEFFVHLPFLTIFSDFAISHVKMYKKLPGEFCDYKKIPVYFRRTEKSLYACKDDQNGGS